MCIKLTCQTHLLVRDTPKKCKKKNPKKKRKIHLNAELISFNVGSRVKCILKVNSLPLITCCHCCPPRNFAVTIQAENLGWIGNSFQSTWQLGDPQELLADTSLSLSMLRGQHKSWLPGPSHSGTAWVSPQTEIKMWKAAWLKVLRATPHGILFFCCDSSSETPFFSCFTPSFLFFSFFFDNLTTREQSCQGQTCLIDRARNCLCQHGVKFDFLHVRCANPRPLITSAWWIWWINYLLRHVVKPNMTAAMTPVTISYKPRDIERN